MFLKLAHTNLDVYGCSRKLVLECYKLTKALPDSERYGLTTQIRRAATSIPLNIAEGCSRKSLTERKRYFEIARGSLIEIDTAFDLTFDLQYTSMDQLQPIGELLVREFKMLSRMINNG